MEELLKELCMTPGVSGDESKIASIIKQRLSNFLDIKVENDGSVIASVGPPKAENHIMFDAHIDQIGLVVTEVNKSGFIRFATCGGIDNRILYGSTVVVNGREAITGIICSASSSQRSRNKSPGVLEVNDLFIDIGTSNEDIISNISVGDHISFYPRFYKLLNNNIVSPSTDDRAGVCVLVKLAERLSREDLCSKVTFLFSSKEEVGRIGAKTSAFKCNPSEAIAVDVSFAKQPGLTKNKIANINGGPMVGIAPCLSKQISSLLMDISRENNIPYQLEVMGEESGTNADTISLIRSGVPCGLISLPQRYMHSNVEMINLTDMQNTVELLFNYAKLGGICLCGKI